MRPLLACGRTIKFHFCWANVFELAIKQRFSPPSQRTTRPRRGVGPFSFFVYSPTNWFCGIHRPFRFSLLSSSSSPSSTALLLYRPRETRSYFGVRKYTWCSRARGVPTSISAGGRSTTAIDKGCEHTVQNFQIALIYIDNAEKRIIPL